MPCVPDPPCPAAVATLDESQVELDPLRPFAAWFLEALSAHAADAHTMTVATTMPEARPAAPLVLRQGDDTRGDAVSPNDERRKGDELVANPAAARLLLAGTTAADPRRRRRQGALGRRIGRRRLHAPTSSRVGAGAWRQSTIVGRRTDLDRRDAQVRVQDGGGRRRSQPSGPGSGSRPTRSRSGWSGPPACATPAAREPGGWSAGHHTTAP